MQYDLIIESKKCLILISEINTESVIKIETYHITHTNTKKIK